MIFSANTKPWFEPKPTLKVKTNEYIHQKTDLLNSLAHSSPKVSEFYLKSQVPLPLPKHPSQKTEGKRAGSRDQLKRRKLEREMLQSRSSQCIGFTHPLSSKPVFTTYKDPAARPVICKAQTFENYNELPENRLKLVVNNFILEKDAEALKQISKKLEEEQRLEDQIKTWHTNNRIESLARTHRQMKRNQVKEEKAGISKVKIQKQTPVIRKNDRIDQLSTAKSVKIGLPVDYLESAGLLTAGVLSSDKSNFPKSSRQPTAKRVDSVGGDWPAGLAENKPEVLELKEFDLISKDEIKKQMKEMDVFDKRLRNTKERQGFPHIDLEKFQNKLF